MTPVFADTFFFLALMNADDEAHSLAATTKADGRSTITTDFVLLELADHLCNRRNRGLFTEFYSFLTRDPTIEVVPVSEELLAKGRVLYAQRPDKDWSLTDCTSFAVMTERGMTDALTADHHFEQAGFVALLK